MYVVDTDVLIDIQRGNAAALAWFGRLAELPSVPGFVVMELIQDAQNARQVRQVLKLVAPLPVIWPTEMDFNRALADFTKYNLSHSLGLLDALFAACAVGLSATLCTLSNIIKLSLASKHYSRTSDSQAIRVTPLSRRRVYSER